MLSFELAALRLKKCSDEIDGDEQISIVQNLCSARYKEILKDEYLLAIFNVDSWLQIADSASLPDFERLCIDCISKAFDGCDNAEKQKRTFGLLAIAVSCVQLFAQNNWVGPPVDLPSWLSKLNDTFESCAFNSGGFLAVDGEAAYPSVSSPFCLHLARLILFRCSSHLVCCSTTPWWSMRCLYLHQNTLAERSTSLKNSFMDLIAAVMKTEIMTVDKNRDLAIEFHLEAGHLLFYFYEPSLADEHFTTARQLSHLSIELTGAMGKRTRFQEKEVSQLVLRVQRTGEGDPEVNPSSVGPLPKNVALDDDTIMESIVFSDSEQKFSVNLRAFEAALFLGLCHLHRKTSETKGSILEEETLAYINAVLSQPISWSVQSAALLQRTNWQLDSMRRMQRSLGQLEELSTQFGRSEPRAADRLALLYASNLPPLWEVERRLGNFLIKVGSVNSALDVFIRHHMYEEVIKCYTSLGRREKAEEVIRARLAIQETDSLWCYLGDVTHNEEDYMKAWDLSKGRCARAQRSLGFLFLNKGEFEKCLPFFECSLKVNALQVPVWFSYGCAALGCSQYKTAALAFRRCVMLTPENHEAWNNLSSAYIRDGQKDRAFVTFQEAIRLDFENWHIWENYLVLSTDLGEFKEAIRSCHRILDMRKKFSDIEVLKVLVRAVTEDIKDAQDVPSSQHAPELKKLFGRITSKVTASGDVWRLYGELLLGAKDLSAEDLQRAVQYLQKSHRCATQTKGWEREQEKCVQVMDSMGPLVSAYLQCANQIEDKTEACQLLASARLAIKGVIAQIKQNHVDVVTNEMREDLCEPFGRLEQLLLSVSSVIDERKT